MSARSRQSLRGLTLTILVPCLLFSAVLAGWVTYRDLYRVILNDGFEQKLVAVSTGVAAFVDGDVHLELSRLSRVTGLAADPVEPVLWGLDPLNDRLVRVDMTTGGAEAAGPLPAPDLAALGYDASAGRLLTVRAGTGEILAFEPGSATLTPVGFIEGGAHDLALDRTGARLVAAGAEGLRGYVRTEGGGGFALAWTMPEEAQGVAIHPETGALYVLQPSGALLVADSSGAPLRRLGLLAEGEPEYSAAVLSQVTALTASHLRPVLFASGARLVSLSPEDLSLTVDRFRRGYRNPGSEAYRAYLEPMRRIRAALDITYLYTQNLAAGDSVQYIVDSTPGEDHSPIGAREALEAESDIRGLADVMERGTIYSSGIENSEEWGLLKSAYAPIIGYQGVPVGMVGTDISVATIQHRTQIALAKVGLVTVLVLFLGGLGSVAISLRLTGPLALVQQGASRVAAGRMFKPLDPPRLRDLAALTTSFNEMTHTLISSVNALNGETVRVSAMRTRRHLLQELTARAAAIQLPVGVSVEPVGWDPAVAPAARIAVVPHSAAGVCVAWLHPVAGDAVTVLAAGEEFRLVARRCFERAGGDPTKALALLYRFCGGEDSPVLLVELASREVTTAAGHEAGGALRRGGTLPEPVVVRGDRRLAIPPGTVLEMPVGPGAGTVAAASGSWVLRVEGPAE